MKNRIFSITVFSVLLIVPLKAQMLADITSDVETEFGTYRPYLVDVIPSLEPYTVESDFSNVVNFADYDFSAAEQTLLLQNGFVARFQPNRQQGTGYKQIYDIYYECRDNQIPIFVTSDALLHTFHILYDYTLRIMELDQFVPDLDSLTAALVVRAQEHYAAISDSALKQAALKNLAYFSVAAVLLDSTFTVPDDVQEIVQEELDLIGAHAGPADSPIFTYSEDYSQYVPRGHYTRNADFQRFFRAMMWYGRITFHLKYPFMPEATIKEATRQALLLVHAMHNIPTRGESALTVWDRIYAPTVFFVGKADDLTLHDYASVMTEVYGGDFAQQPVDIFADHVLLEQFRTLADDLPWPEINAWKKGFRFMGQRYIPDSYMLDQLVYPFVVNRLMPRGLDVMTVLGSERAWQILDDYYNEHSDHQYVAQIDTLKEQFTVLPAATWAQNLYWNWLYSLMPLLFPKGEGYPTFMQNQAWEDRELIAALGSWGELRHDTILYAKQSATEVISVPPRAPFTPGYVEPNPQLYARLAALTAFIAEGLATRDLFFPEFDWRYDDMEELLLSLKAISEKELVGQDLSTADYEVIINIGETLDELTSFPAELEFESDTDEDMAVVADVHTDFNTLTVLEEGVGYPLSLYVITEINGQLYVTRGGMFSYYEFVWPMADRLTDEAWQAMQSGEAPQTLPEWVESFFDDQQELSNPDPQHVHAMYDAFVGLENGDPVPARYRLYQNHPNPFNPATAIRFDLPAAAAVRLVVYDLLGRVVVVLVDGRMEAGYHQVIWNGTSSDGREMPTGIYIVRLLVPLQGGETPAFTKSIKMVLMK
ncbi:MAG: DUF3160 domain-containing protein [Candidatus Neomarinimicrobiota bacterium]